MNADGLVSTGQGLLGSNMFAYCLNNPVIYGDNRGMTPYIVLDINGDGNDDCYVYTYKYTTGFWWWKKEHVGYVYIYVNVDQSFFDNPENQPQDFNAATDIMIGDFTVPPPDVDPSKFNPSVYAYNAHKTKTKYRDEIIDCIDQYDKDFNTLLDRTKDSMLLEWKEHKRYALVSDSAKHVDFDNKEEGKGSIYYAKKAILRVVDAIENKTSSFINSIF